MIPPSGEQHELAFGDQHAVVVEPAAGGSSARRRAFRTGEGLIRLEPGDRFAGTWGIQP